LAGAAPFAGAAAGAAGALDPAGCGATVVPEVAHAPTPTPPAASAALANNPPTRSPERSRSI
jgi:hypothetical protein